MVILNDIHLLSSNKHNIRNQFIPKGIIERLDEFAFGSHQFMGR